MLEVNTRVAIAEKQLHGNQSNILDGSIVSINGSSAKVLVDGEEFPRDFAMDTIKSQEETFGAEMTSRFDHQVVNALPRR